MFNWYLVLIISLYCLSVIFAFHTVNVVYDNEEAKPDVLQTNFVVKRSASIDTETHLKSDDGHHDNQTNTATNETGGREQGSHSESSHSHHKIHLATLNFDHVKSPLIIALFLLAAGIAKLGK